MVYLPGRVSKYELWHGVANGRARQRRPLHASSVGTGVKGQGWSNNGHWRLVCKLFKERSILFQPKHSLAAAQSKRPLYTLCCTCVKAPELEGQPKRHAPSSHACAASNHAIKLID